MHHGIHGKFSYRFPRIVDARFFAKYTDKLRTLVLDGILDEIFQFFQHGNEVALETIFLQHFCSAGCTSELNILDICSGNKILRVMTQHRSPGRRPVPLAGNHMSSVRSQCLRLLLRHHRPMRRMATEHPA